MNISIYKSRFARRKKPILKHADIIKKHAHEIVSSDSFQSQDEFIQHGDVSVSQHCLSVANTSLVFSRALKLKVKERAIIRGALLHDYFLYDWHLPHDGGKWHGFKHAHVALKNAERDFKLSKLEKNIINRHMWPLNITRLPATKEEWIVNIADTYCSTLETLRITKGWKKKDKLLLKDKLINIDFTDQA